MTKNEKKQYEKPEVKRVDLDGRTSVLGFCKTPNVRGPLVANCKVVGSCNALGS
jgi:hypothetical protein